LREIAGRTPRVATGVRTTLRTRVDIRPRV
jgi:hypothetical protein